MNKPTAQELWERIGEEIKGLPHNAQDKTWFILINLIGAYAQAFAQEKVVEYEQKIYDIDTLRLISNETQNND